MKVELITPEKYTDDFVVDCARVSFAKRSDQFTPEQNAKLIRYLNSPPDSVPHWAPFAGPRICFGFGMALTPESWAKFLTHANLAGFSWAALGYDAYQINGSLWAWKENLHLLPKFHAEAIQNCLVDMFPICAGVFGWEQTGMSFPQVQANRASTVYENLRIKAPIFVARQLVKHQVHLVWSESCFDPTTEVLTDSGWKFWPDVLETDRLACPSRDGTYRILPHQGLIVEDFSGELIQFTNRDLDVLCTPNHNLLVSETLVRGYTDWAMAKASEVEQMHRPRFPSLPVLDVPEGTANDYWQGFLYGAFLGDGSVSEDGNRVYFHVKKKRKVDMLDNLSAHTPELNWSKSPQEDGYTYFRFYVPEDLKGKFWGRVKDKSIKLSGSEPLTYLRGLKDGLVATDGHVTSKNSTSFSTVSKSLKDSIETLGDMLGFDTSTIESDREGWSKSYKMSIKVNRPRVVRSFSRVPYTGKVYCAQSPTGLLLVRRNGKKAVVGNSRRYVKDRPDLWWPREFHKAPTHSKQGASKEKFKSDTLLSAMSQAAMSVNSYEDLIEEGLAPEEARMLLPQNMMTEWIWTGSIAAFQRVCRERLAPGAQGATREVAQMIDSALAQKHGSNWREMT